MTTAIQNQLLRQGIDASNIKISNIDTALDPRFYSNNRAGVDKTKSGRFYMGCFYKQEKEEQKVKLFKSI